MTPTTDTRPPLTPELIEAAKEPYRADNREVIDAYRQAYDYARRWWTIADTSHHILTRALSAHRPIPLGGTKVGDLVSLCHSDPVLGTNRAIMGFGLYPVEAVCPFRGVFVGIWHRSWVRVKGGAA